MALSKVFDIGSVSLLIYIFSAKFGLVKVNFTTLERTLRESGYYYSDLVKSHLINGSETQLTT